MNPRSLLLGGLLMAAAVPNAKLGAGSLPDGVHKKVLRNGLTLLVKPVSSAPVVAVNAWVKVGSVHENAHERGITHFIEHMLFKGTPSLKVGELDHLIKKNGGYNNAHTRYESTDFIDVMPADKIDIAIETMADALRNSTFDAQELDRERLVVLEEMSRAQDNPSFEAWNRLTNTVFDKHPYRFPIIGYKDVLKAMSQKDLLSYWRRWYRPANLVLVVVGDVDAKQALAKLEQAFGDWDEAAAKPKNFPKEPEPKALKVSEFTGEIETTLAIVGVPGPAELDADAPAVDMLLSILGQGASSRLNQSVREKQKLAHTVYAGQFNGASPGLIYLWAELEPAQVRAALPAMWQEVERIKRDGVSEPELQRQRLRLEHDEASERMSMEGMAGKLGYYESLGGDYTVGDKMNKLFAAVTSEDVKRVAAKYFQPQRATVVVYRPTKSASTGMDDKAWARAFAKAADFESARVEASLKPVRTPGMAAKALNRTDKNSSATGVTMTTLANGVRLLVKPTRHTPLVSAHILFEGGSQYEVSKKAGGLNLLARLLMKGVPGMDAEALAQALDDQSASFGPWSEVERFGVAGQMLSSRLRPSLELLGQVLREATLPQDEVEKERERVLKDIKDKPDNASELVGDLFNATFFGTSAYGRPEEGSAASVAGLKRADLLALRQNQLRPDRMLVVLVGDVDLAEAKAAVEQAFGPERWSASGKLAPKPKGVKVSAVARKVSKKAKKKQAHIMLGWPGPAVTDKDYYAARLVNSIMGEGMDSRLFKEVREKRGLCYTINSSFDRRPTPGAWRVYVGTKPESEKEATRLALKVVAAMAAGEFTQEDLDSAKSYAKGIFKVARQDFSTEARLLANYESWNLGAQEIDRMDAKIDAVSLADAKRVAKRFLRVDKTTQAVVRP